jgi:hypothetical protein
MTLTPFTGPAGSTDSPMSTIDFDALSKLAGTKKVKAGETWAEKMKAKYSDIKIIPLDELLKLPGNAGDFHSGIYFLWLKGKLQYIGKSRQICNRMNHHVWAAQYGHSRSSRTKIIPFDRYTYLQLGNDERVFDSRVLDPMLQRYERAYIAHYLPPFNFDGANPGT